VSSSSNTTNSNTTNSNTTTSNTTNSSTNTVSNAASNSVSNTGKDSESTNKLVENNATNTEKTTETTQINTTQDKTSNDLEDLTGKTVKVNFDLSLKLLPTLSSNKVDSIKSGDEVKVIYDFNNWIKVEYNSNSGWLPKSAIKADSVTTSVETNSDKDDDESIDETENTSTVTTNSSTTSTSTATSTSSTSETKKGYINVETANVRETASKTSSIVDTLDEFDTVTILEDDGEWYRIESGDIKGYVSKGLVTIGTQSSSRSLTEERTSLIEKEAAKTSNSSSESSDSTEQVSVTAETINSSSKGQEVVDFAKQYLGLQYVLGGKSPETGFDCSGFTKYVFKNFGYTLGSVAADQVSSGREVSREELQPGDLLLFYDEAKTRIGHVGIYMGNDEFIHAANSKRGVVTDTLSTNTYYNSRYVTARRIVE
jgi:N-acetylmuramoyl-L-alanine amidase